MKETTVPIGLEHTDHGSLRILLVSPCDQGGGAEQSAWNLFKSYRNRGHRTFLAVRDKRTDDPGVLLIPNDASRSRWAKTWLGIRNHLLPIAGHIRGVNRLDYLLHWIGEPRRWSEIRQGHEDFNFPGTRRLLELSECPDIIHCYNLHGGYFDLRELTWLSHRLPVILDLRDAWLLSGHCAHSLGCERWRTGCGDCPDLTIYPAISRDATAYNWQRKREIYAKSRLYVSTPSRWLMQKVEQSILSPAIIESRVIPTGVDLTIFRRADKSAARSALNLPQHAKILLFAANRVRQNVWKDFDTLKAAISLVGNRPNGKNLLFIALGENAPPERVGETEIRSIPHQNSSETVARYYQAADLYVHAARAETFPRVVLEALACGTPVVATAVGGIPEQIKGLKISPKGSANIELNSHTSDEATGILVGPGDAEAMASGIERLLSNDLLRQQLGVNAAKDARQRFNLQTQTDRYLEWYQALLRRRHGLERSSNSSFLPLQDAAQ